ncbi:hypothetical protein X275_11185 [Marinitoga sp. 1197]|nr:hypothetical protein X275_11185 [Marinitoga sp. 1197]
MLRKLIQLMDYCLICINNGVIKIIASNISKFKGSSVCLVNQNKFVLNNMIESIKKTVNINDIFEIFPEGGNIKISEIREMQEFLLYKPNFSDYKLIIIHEIDKMNIQAANSALKILEEPPDFAIIITTTMRWYNLLPTIRSRLYKILLPNPDFLNKIKGVCPECYVNLSYSIKNDFECANYILENPQKRENILNTVKSFPDLDAYNIVEYIMNEKDDIENRIYKYEAFFELIKRFEKLNLIEIQNIIDKILSYKNKIDDKLKTLKFFSKLFLALYHDSFIFSLTNYWKEFYSLNMVYFFGLYNFDLDFKKIYENIKWCEDISKSTISNFNFDLTIQTMFLRFIQAFFKNKEDSI